MHKECKNKDCIDETNKTAYAGGQATCDLCHRHLTLVDTSKDGLTGLQAYDESAMAMAQRGK